MKREVTVDELKAILPAICSRETSADPTGWTRENHTWGHCAVASLIVNDHLGGGFVRGDLSNTPFAAMRSHYWNELPNGEAIDLTAEQFLMDYPIGMPELKKDRTYVMGKDPNARMRYKKLRFAASRALSGNPLIFTDPTYKQCFYQALDSPCKKMRFGCVIKATWEGMENITLYEGCNTTIEPLAHLCEPECIRNNIQSRTDGMVGACGHAEEKALWDIVRRGISPELCELYVAGVYMDGLPWLKERAESTCLRCGVQEYLSGIKMIYVPLRDGWQPVDPARAVHDGCEYATGVKKV